MTKSPIKNPLNATEFAKLAAAKCAVDFVQDGMRLGLGTGSTAAWMVRALADRIAKEGLKVQGVPTSSRTAALAHALNVPIVTLDQAKWLDLTIDGADEFDPARGWISMDSPMARALMKKTLDDEVRVATPDGDSDYVVIDVRYSAADNC